MPQFYHSGTTLLQFHVPFHSVCKWVMCDFEYKVISCLTWKCFGMRLSSIFMFPILLYYISEGRKQMEQHFQSQVIWIIIKSCKMNISKAFSINLTRWMSVAVDCMCEKQPWMNQGLTVKKKQIMWAILQFVYIR